MPFILFGYLSRQVLQIMLAVTLAVLIIIMSGRFVNYLAQAATGSLKASFLFAIMGYRIPEFLVMILPLGLFIGIILAHGRLYVDNEMTVLNICGVSRNQILIMTMVPAVVVMFLVGILSMYIAPGGIKKVETIFSEQESLTEFDTLVSGRFQKFGHQRVTYTEELSHDRQQMNHVFIAHTNASHNGMESMGITLLLADTARLEVSPEGGGSGYLILTDGFRYDLAPGMMSMREIEFKNYGVRLEKPRVKQEVNREQSLSMSELIKFDTPENRAEIQWRISLPLLIPIIVLMAVALAKVNPRQGRYIKVLPGMLLYLLYLALLMSGRGAIENGRLSPEIGLWPIHLIFLFIALFLYGVDFGRLWLASYRSDHA